MTEDSNVHVNAHTSNGAPVQVTLSSVLQWVMGVCSVLATAAVIWFSSEMLEIRTNMRVLEQTAASSEELNRMRDDLTRQIVTAMSSADAEFVTVREYSQFQAEIRRQQEEIREYLAEIRQALRELREGRSGL